MKSFASVVALLAMLCTSQVQAQEVIDAVVYTKKGEVPLSLEVAATPKSRVLGLMNRDELAPHDGMLFLFPTPYDYSFWMKDTRIPLDMLFVDAKHRVVHIEADVPPYTKAERSSGKQIVAVIELDGGRALRESIAKGDHVRYDLPASLEIQ